jgi:signal peptidase I
MPPRPRPARRKPGAPAAEPQRRNDAAGNAKELLRSLLLAFVLFLVVRTFVLQTFVITSGSMEDTLLVGDFLVLSKLSYGPLLPFGSGRLPGFGSPQRGHIIVFRPPHDPDVDVVKRLVGVPGDTLAMRAGILYVNGAPAEEPYLKFDSIGVPATHPWMAWQLPHLVAEARSPDYQPTINEWGPLVIPAGNYFVLGDHRTASLDSRYWGFLEEHRVSGKASFLYYSYEPASGARVPWLQSVRWARLFGRIR